MINVAPVLVTSPNFTEPKSRNYNMQKAYALGPEQINVPGPRAYIWESWVDANNNLQLQREDLPNSKIIFTLSKGQQLQQLDLAFDANSRPFFVTVIDGKVGYLFYNNNTSYNASSLNTLPPTVNYPRCEFDNNPIISKTDIIMGYLNAGNLCYRQQRDNFAVEYIIQAVPGKTMLWRQGLIADGRMQFQLR